MDELKVKRRSPSEFHTISTDVRLKDKEWLYQEYIVFERSPRQIASENGLSASTINSWVIYHNLDKRDLKGAISLLDRKGANSNTFGKDAPHSKGSWVQLNGISVYMRSTWEVLVSKYLTKQGLNFKYEEVRYNLGDITYRPDFFIYKENGELDYIVEVKGWLGEGSIRKALLFQTLYPDIPYYIWDKEIINLIKKEVA